MSTRVLTGKGLAMAVALTVGLVLGCSGRLDFDPDATGTTAPARAGEEPGTGTPGNAPAEPSQPAPNGAPGTGTENPAPGAMSAQPSAVAMPADAGAPQAEPKSEPPPPVATGCDNLEALDILIDKCGKCHGQQSPTKGLDLVSPGVLTRLVDVRSTCQGRMLLEEGPTGAGGFFLDKLDGPVMGCGVQMPFGVPPLTETERACLDSWAEQAVQRVKMGVTP